MNYPSLKIALISQWYTPEPVPFPHDIASELQRRGHKVNVLTGFPNYPSGKLYPGYRQRWQHVEHLDGVRISRRPIFPSHDDSPLRRATNYISFAANASTYIHHLKGADVIFVYGTPLTATIPALFARSAHGVPYVVQVQDLWPDSVTASGMVRHNALASIAATGIHHMARHVYRNAAAMIAISESMTQELIERGAKPRSAHRVYNWSPREEISSARPSRRDDVTRFLYAGNLGEMQDLETVVRATRLAEDHCNLEVLIIGDGVMTERLKALATSLGVRSVTFAGRVPPEEMDEYYAEADFSLVTLLDRDVFALTVPSKFQAALARAVPVVTTVLGEVAAICDRYDCGFTAAPQNPESLAWAMRKAADLTSEARTALRRNARQTYQSLFARDAAITRIESILCTASSNVGVI